MKESIIKDTPGFRLRVKSWKCVNPATLNALEFIQECKNINGEVDMTSTYQFFMTDDELKILAQSLVS
jgi:hypothetical protein